jgi:pimeloyl-ACP methyl ester carboxylesterase
MDPMLAYTTRGEGDRVVIMLHGFLGSGRNLGSLARRLSDRDRALRIVLPDLTGHGSSPPLLRDADLSTLARDILSLVDAIAPSSTLEIAGHSLGGRVALKASALRPEARFRIALLDIAPGPIADARSELGPIVDVLLRAPESGNSRRDFDVALGELSRPMIDWLLTNVVKDPERGDWRWRFDRQALAELQKKTSIEDLWPEVQRLGGAAIREIRGARSRFVTDEDVARLLAIGATVETIADASHFLHVDQPDETLDALGRWLEAA